MLPPVAHAVLEANPAFASLYSTLTNVVLNPDGSTRHDAATRPHATVDEAGRSQKLDEYRLDTAKKHLVERALAAAAPPASAASFGPLHALLAVLPCFLRAEPSLPADAAALLRSRPPLSHVAAHLPDLAALVSGQLHAAALGLAHLAHPETDPSHLHRCIVSLPDHRAALAERLAKARQSLAAARLRALEDLAGLIDGYTNSLACLVRSLEAKHSVVARGLELCVQHLSLEAQRTEIEAAGNALDTLARDVYSPQAVAALESYSQHLDDASARLAGCLRTLQAQLAEHGVNAPGDHGSEYRQVGDPTHDLDKQLGRLSYGSCHRDEWVDQARLP